MVRVLVPPNCACRWRIVDYVWWAINVLELVVRATSHRRRFWITQRADGGWSFHVRNIVGVAVLAAAALFSVAVRLDGFFFIIGSLRLPMVLACVPPAHLLARVFVVAPHSRCLTVGQVCAWAVVGRGGVPALLA